jgi:Tfp pilus assembly protein FimT
MIVIAIMAIVMTIGVPAIYRIWKKESLPKTVKEITDVLDNARSLAILKGNPTEVVFNAQEGTFTLSEAAGSGGAGGGTRSRGEQLPTDFGASPQATPNAGHSGKFPEEIAVAQLKINGISCMDYSSARVRFYPNGTCDELRLILLRPENGESRGIFLEVTTGLVDTESAPAKLASEIR